MPKLRIEQGSNRVRGDSCQMIAMRAQQYLLVGATGTAMAAAAGGGQLPCVREVTAGRVWAALGA